MASFEKVDRRLDIWKWKTDSHSRRSEQLTQTFVLFYLETLRFGHPLDFHVCIQALPQVERAWMRLRLECMEDELSFVVSSDSPRDDIQAFVRHTLTAHLDEMQVQFNQMEYEWEQWWLDEIQEDFFGAVCTLADDQDACSTFLLAERHGEGPASLVWNSPMREPHVLRDVFEFVCGEPYYGTPSPPPRKRRKLV